MLMLEPFRLNVENRSICGLVHLPSAAKPPCVITCHGLFSSKDSDKFTTIADYFAAHGIAVIRFDFGGCGESTGSIADTTVSKRLKELQAIVAFARQHPSLAPELGLLGSSLGGYVSLLYAAQDPAIRALSVWATPYNLLKLRHNIPEDELRQLQEDFFIDAAQYHLEPILSAITTVQIIQGKNDTIVSYTHAEELFSRVNHPKELHILPDGDHSLIGPQDRQTAIENSLRWFQTYLRI
jgi:alpha-beta hydrolase superfamily lysophospholipase